MSKGYFEHIRKSQNKLLSSCLLVVYTNNTALYKLVKTLTIYFNRLLFIVFIIVGFR